CASRRSPRSRCSSRPRSSSPPQTGGPEAMSRNLILSSGHGDAEYRQAAAAMAVVAALAALVAALAWAVPVAAAWVHSGRPAQLGLLDAVRALADGELL